MTNFISLKQKEREEKLRDVAEGWLQHLGYSVERNCDTQWTVSKPPGGRSIMTNPLGVRVVTGQPDARGAKAKFHILWFETEPPQDNHLWLVAWYKHRGSSTPVLQLTVGSRSKLDQPSNMPYPYRTEVEGRSLDRMLDTDYIERHECPIDTLGNR